MPEQLTYESVLALIQENTRKADWRMKKIAREREKDAQEWRERTAEIDRLQKKNAQQMKETDRLAKEAHKKNSELDSRIGEIIEGMVEGGIIDKFQALGYEIIQCGRNVKFWHPKTVGIRGEIDLLYEGDVEILIEVKTTLETSDVRRHMERLEKYRQCFNAKAESKQKRFVGAVAGAVVKDEAKNFAHENGIYVIVQSGEAFEIVKLPEGVQAKEW